MNTIKEIQFVDIDTGAPLVTIDGDNAQILLEQSELIQTLAESWNRPSKRVLEVPIGGFTNERRTLFVNILKGLPVGKRDYWGHTEYYPIGEKEEQNIARAVNDMAKASVFIRTPASREHDINDERKQVIYEVMRYLIIPDELIEKMLNLDYVDYLYSSNVGYDDEDIIEQNLRYHEKWLFLTGQKEKLTPSELESTQEYFENAAEDYEAERKRWQKQSNNAAQARLRRRTMRRRRRYYNNSNNNNNDNNNNAINYMGIEIEDRYKDLMDPETYKPEGGDVTSGMTVREYERWLRTVRYKKAPLELNQLHLNALYNENRRAERGRVNRPQVIFVNNNNTGTRRKKNTNKNKNKEKGEKKSKAAGSGGDTNGSAW